MNLPFTVEQFFDVMKSYNLTVFPMQIVFNIVALAAIFFAIKNIKYSDKIISSILGFFWLWIGIVYHLIFFTTINNAAYLFGFLFIVQGLLFLIFVLTSDNLSFKFKSDSFGITGSIFILYALIIYPLLGAMFGHTYPSNPTFGLPCPTTIFTFGILLWSVKQIPWYVIVIPFLWSLLGTSAAINLGVKEDLGLVVAGVLGLTLIIIKNKHIKKAVGYTTA